MKNDQGERLEVGRNLTDIFRLVPPLKSAGELISLLVCVGSNVYLHGVTFGLNVSIQLRIGSGNGAARGPPVGHTSNLIGRRPKLYPLQP